LQLTEIAGVWGTYGGTALNVIFAHRLTIVHGVKCCNLVNTHWWHFQDARNLVHNTDTSPAVVLALPKVEQRHDCGFFILTGIAGKDFFDQTFVLFVELERDRWVVVRCVAMLISVNNR